MDPTSPIKPKSPVGLDKASNRRVTNKSDKAAPASESSTNKASESSSTVAESVHEAKRLIENGRTEVHRIDEQHLAELKQAISDGTYRVPTEALAERLVGDAFGEE